MSSLFSLFSSSSFKGVDLSNSGQTHTLDLSQGNFFDGGILTQDTTLEFRNVTPLTKFSYTAVIGDSGSNPLESAFLKTDFNVLPQMSSGSSSRELESLFFKPDGTKMYLMVQGIGQGEGYVYEYSLLTPWDVSTAYYESKMFDFEGLDVAPMSFFIGANGTKMYMAGGYGLALANPTTRLYEYSLSTAWGLNNKRSQSVSLDRSSTLFVQQDPAPTSMFFKPDGTVLYMLGRNTDTVYQYNFSTPWNISTLSYSGLSFSDSAVESGKASMYISPEGNTLYIFGTATRSIRKYTLSTPWNISTATYDNVSYVESDFFSGSPIAFNNDETKMYVAKERKGLIEQYDLLPELNITLPDNVKTGKLIRIKYKDRITYEFLSSNDPSDISLTRQYNSF